MLGYAVMKSGGAGSWQQQRIFGWFRDIREWRVLGVVGARICLGCAFWQVKLQECVNDTYDV